MADEEQQEGAEEKPKSKMMLIIVVALVAVLAGGGGAAFFLMSGGDDGGAAEDSEEVAANAVAVYFELKPPFVVNYNWKGRQRYVQISVAIMTRNEAVIEALQKHMPLVRNNLVMVFGSQEFEGLKTQEGKEALRQKALEELQTIVSDELGEPGVEKILFTNFVMQ